ncbi:MAG: chloride channel protein [Bacteroidia bacterium]|nr:chloride channel protein [Bacteroidia bacterium]
MIISLQKIIKRILIWRLRHVSDRVFILFLSVVIGITSGIAAVIIKRSVHLIQHFLRNNTFVENHLASYVILPAAGILLVVLFIKYFLRQPVRHGIPNVLYGISKNNGRISPHNMFSSIITSAVTVGFGGSVGLEGPTVATGAAYGSALGRLMHLNYKQTTLLLGCAATGAMAAIFKAPVAAIVFALEVIMLDLTLSALIPLLLASASAIVTSYLFLGQDVLYPFDTDFVFDFSKIHFYIILGIITGLFSVYFTKIYIWINGIFEQIKGDFKKWIIGALLLGLLIFLFPALYGEGYEITNFCLQGEAFPLFEGSLFQAFSHEPYLLILLILALIILKAFATSITFGAGGIGGIFAPTLFMGANAGLVFALVLNGFSGEELFPGNFSLLGMAGMIAGVLHAPLTGIFLIGDITGGYKMFLPLMITATFSFLTTRLFLTNSVYTIQLAKRKELITHHKDKAVLSMMEIPKLIENNFITVHPDNTLGQLCDAIAKSTRNIFPVIDDEGHFLGIVFLDDVRKVMFKPELYTVHKVKEFTFMPEPVINYEEDMETVANKFRITDNFTLPVIKEGKYVGFISRAKLFSTYRRKMRLFSDE